MIAGRIYAESRTSIELIDAAAKQYVLQRDLPQGSYEPQLNCIIDSVARQILAPQATTRPVTSARAQTGRSWLSYRLAKWRCWECSLDVD